MLRSASFGSLISRDKGDARVGQQMPRTASSIQTVECRGVPVPESRHPACLNEAPKTQENDDVQKPPIVQELERKNCHNIPHLFEGGVDLLPLTSVLSSASEVFEADLLWDRDSLLQETHEVGESSRPPQSDDDIFRTQLVDDVAMFSQVMQNPRFFAFLQLPLPSQPVGSQEQSSP
ncbi:hypothetical protein L7F22_014563 [Adiantum nelumboides]|nr:hypothetical protein [Adiantum nelumboides]